LVRRDVAPRDSIARAGEVDTERCHEVSFSGWWWLEHGWIMTFHSVRNNTPNWRTHIFQKGGEKPPTSFINWGLQSSKSPGNPVLKTRIFHG
jgi:hypothetical protein